MSHPADAKDERASCARGAAQRAHPVCTTPLITRSGAPPPLRPLPCSAFRFAWRTLSPSCLMSLCIS